MADDNDFVRAVSESRFTRRSLLKWTAALGGAAALAGGGLKFGLETMEPSAAQALSPEQTIWNACNVNCAGGRCVLRLVVRDGQIVRVKTDNTGADVYGDHQARACVRGRAIRKVVYNPDRLKYPMKRVGKRGAGEFERISWSEAYDMVASSLKRIRDQYGNEAIDIHYASGTVGATMLGWGPSSPIGRLMSLYGGYLNEYGSYSAAQTTAAMPYTYGGPGAAFVANSISDIVNSKLVVFFGVNPAATNMSGGGVIYDVQHALEVSDVKIIVIGPVFTDTAVIAPDEWIPSRPGTDAALVSGLAYVMITENLVDQAFLDKYCVGYDESHMPAGVPANSSYKSYILGLGADQTPKTPQWAAEITGVPATTIVRLAREIAQAKPCYIAQGWGPQRQANGEENARAVAMLPILTGNVGIQGGNPGTREGAYVIPFAASFPMGPNPVTTAIPCFLWTDAIYRGAEMTALRDGVQGKAKLDVPIKFIWNYAGNCLINQHADINWTKPILEDDTLCEMIVVIDTQMMPSAKYADLLLPDASWVEKDDFSVQTSGGTMGYVIANCKAIEPLFESQSVYDMCVEIAKRLGIEQQFTEGKTYDQWLQSVYDESRIGLPGLPDYATFRKNGIYKQKNPGKPPVAYESFRQDPVKNPLATPSGKIEIFSKSLWEISKTWELPAGDVITALPEYTPTWEGVSDPLRAKYPLQLINDHYKQRAHSTYGNVPWLQEVNPQECWINTLDAKPRGIVHGDKVKVYNGRGATMLVAKVTERVMPGVAWVAEGAWYSPDKDGVDQGGCPNVLTNHRPSPLAKGDPMYTCLVQIVKA